MHLKMSPASVILLPAHPASFAYNFVYGMQSFYFRESHDANSIAGLSLIVVFWTHKFAVGLIDMGNSESQDPYTQNCKGITAAEVVCCK